MAVKPVDMETVRNRLSEKSDLPAAEGDTRPAAGVRPETIAMAQRYAEDVARMSNSTEKVDMGPIPAGVKVPEGPVDTTYYRGSPADNPKTRKAVESRCSELDFADLVLTGRVKQTVPVLPGKLTFVYQSLIGEEDSWIESNAQRVESTELGVRSFVTYARLTMSIVSFNGRIFPTHMKDGKLDTKLVMAKMDDVKKLGSTVLEIATVNLGWFNQRVEKIFQDDFEALGNG